MATTGFTLQDTPFPDGTSVGAYLATGYDAPSHHGPPGTAVTTATASARQVAFTGLALDTPYFAMAEVGGAWRYVQFRTAPATEPQVWEEELGERFEGTTLKPASLPSSVVTDSSGNGTADWKVVKEAPLNVEWAEYGADGTGVAAADAAFKKALEALPAEGGEIFAPRSYKLTEQLNADGKRTARIGGVGGPTGGSESISRLLFTQGGASSLLSARSISGFSLADIGLYYNNAAQTGALLDLSHSAAETDSSYAVFERVGFIGLGVRSALGANLNKAINSVFRSCSFINLDTGVKGKSEAAAYSNVIGFDRCSFAGMETMAAKNAGEAWDFRTCTFENLHGLGAGAYTSDEGIKAAGLTFDGCWFGDANTTGTWITFRGEGCTVRGGSLGSGALGVYVPDSTSDGLVVQGVRFTTITDAIRANFGTGTFHYVIGGNVYNSVTGKKVSLDNGTTDLGAGFIAA